MRKSSSTRRWATTTIPNQRLYKPFNMNGERYYTFKKGNVRFFALDSNYFDQTQADWLEKALAESTEDWKICFFHHPLYSSGGRHGSEVDLRAQLEPLFLKHGVQVVFAGHEHFYERLKPQKGIYYFVNGGGAKLRSGDITKTIDDRGRIRRRPVVHAGRDRRRRPDVPDAVAHRQARGQRLHPPADRRPNRRRHRRRRRSSDGEHSA